MSAVTLQSPAILSRDINNWPNGNSIELLRPIINDIIAINTDNAGEATLGTNTFTGVQTVANITDTTSGSTGAINTTGGIGATKSVYAGTGLVTASGTQVGSDSPTISQPSGIITTAVTATVPGAYKTVTLTNTFVSTTSKVFVSIGGYGGTGLPVVGQVTNTANTCTIKILNADLGGANLSAAMDLYFFVVN